MKQIFTTDEICFLKRCLNWKSKRLSTLNVKMELSENIFAFSATQVLLFMRGRGVGCPESMRRCIHASILRLLAIGSKD
jgi:hypothetical protein